MEKHARVIVQRRARRLDHHKGTASPRLMVTVVKTAKVRREYRSRFVEGVAELGVSIAVTRGCLGRFHTTQRRVPSFLAAKRRRAVVVLARESACQARL